MQLEDATTWPRLIEFLETWTAANGDPHVYDANGMMAIVGACLTNLAKFSIDADFDELDEVFDARQVAVLRKLLAGASPAR